ncbi:response regulator [Deinococcus aestuarii]|uniref:response regulator n=1 Tax=Deinococcus aestuarii TaxID=2774531 RepID=UPI001C0ADC24
MSKHLLIVEDDGADLELARLALEASEVQCDLSVARDGQEALDLLRGAGVLPDLVLLDLNTPRVSGHEVLAAVKGDATLQHVPVVVFTTSDEARDRTRANSAGADGYVLKPQHFEELIAALNELGQRWLTPLRPA